MRRPEASHGKEAPHPQRKVRSVAAGREALVPEEEVICGHWGRGHHPWKEQAKPATAG